MADKKAFDPEIDELSVMRKKKQTATAVASVQLSQADYERRELSMARKYLIEARRAPLADRKEGQDNFLAAIRETPELVAERIGWLLNGSYGYGAMLLAKQIVGSPRVNRPAALTQMVAAFEWMCPEEMARVAWKRLSTNEQATLERAVRRLIERAERNESA